MSEILEGCWDCTECGRKGIPGREMRCTNPMCGYERPGNVQFYLPDHARVVKEEEEVARAEAGEDWACGWCGAANSALSDRCHACENSRHDPPPQAVEPRQGTYQAVLTRQQHRKQQQQLWTLTGIVLGSSALLLSLGFWFFAPRTITAEINDLTWVRNVTVEEFRAVREGDWSVPTDGRLIRTERRVRTYNKVFSHYEYRTETRTESVPDGTESYSCTQNMGNGYFKSTTCTRPKYKTVTRDERVQTPVYNNVPVYDTWSIYEIDKWVPLQTYSSNGSSEQLPTWPEPKLSANQRLCCRKENYQVSFKQGGQSYGPINLGYREWSKFRIGDRRELTVNRAGRVQLQEKNP
uniref:RanBP2-type domain-containing protein n=1 Tax=Cyanothece sp. (strain PCC 7425 / ATCC 29141) TaxID=395961 RepID=B8HS35_CYAP4